MKRVVMTPNPYRDRDFSCVREAKRILEESGVEVKVCLAFDVDPSFALPDTVELSDLQTELRSADALICFGGDGTILHSSKLAMRRGIPILGVNIGTVGFMAELESGEMRLLAKLATNDYQIDERMTIYVRLIHEGRTIYRDTALNDAVITKGAVARVIALTVKCDGVEAMQFDGDGLVLATPTGTTAYSMSAGGPIVEPTARNIIVTPICAHAMGIRPLVLGDRRRVTAQVGRIGKRSAFLSVDGGKAVKLSADDEVTVTAGPRSVKLAKIKETSYYSILASKIQR